MTVPNSSTINISGPITVEAWIKLTAVTGNYQDIVCREAWGQAGTGGGYEFAITNTGKVRLDLYQSHNQYTTVIGSTTVTTGVWHHVAGVFDGSQMRVYLDGVLDGSLSTTNGPASGTSSLNIGKSTYTTYYFGGLIDEVRISAAALYNSNFTPGLGAASNTRALWKFNGSTTNDSSGNGNHGTLQSAATYSTDVPPVTNNAPTVSVTHPLNNTTVSSGANIVIDATASDSDGVITKVDFYQGTTLLGTDTTSPYTFVWNSVAPGSYSITAKATDDGAAMTTSSAIAVTVIDSSPPRSLSLNGTSQYMTVPNSSTINISGPITVEAWIKLTAVTGNYQDIVCREAWGQAGTGGGYEFAITNTGKVRLDLYQSHNQYTTVIGSTTVTTGVWHHVAGVFDGSQMRVYLDGVLDGSLSTTNGPASGTSSLNIGKSTYTTYYFGGLIDEVRISAAALYNSNFTPGLGAASNTRALWKFNGSTTNDSSGNGNHGTLQSAATYSTDVPPVSGGGSQRPVAVPNGPYTGQLPQSITFISSGSFDPDGTITTYHWNFGDGTAANTANPAHTYAAPGLYTATLTVTDNTGLRASATAPVTISSNGNARLDPRNQTGGGGENPLSRNFNWTLPLVNLPGRAGLDLSLSLSYNSLVWTKTGSYISFDDDYGFPSAGFRLGFPVIQPLYYNQEVGKYAYLLIGSDGSRIELRQVGTSALYESADSAHLLLDTTLNLPVPDNGKFVLRTTDGTKMWYEWKGTDYQCTQIKDRNGNYITINYTPAGEIDTVIDTLNRSIRFNYDSTGQLQTITQVWKQGTANERTHTWASFEYTDKQFQTAFTNLTVSGPSNGSTRKLLSKVTLADNSPTPSNNSSFEFTYTSWGQVWKVSNFAADNRPVNYSSYNLPGWNNPQSPEPQTDCPRFTERRDWAENWNRLGTPATGYMLPTGAEQEVVTAFTTPQPGTANVPGQSSQSATMVQITNADQTFEKIYFLGTSGTDLGWRVGLPFLVESYDVGGSIPRRQVVTTWTQDDETSLFVVNPRVSETNVYDPSDNRKRTEILYQPHVLGDGMTAQLPEDIREYDATASTVLRTTRTIYEDNAAYVGRRIIGLPKQQLLYEGTVSTANLRSKIEFFYDESAIEGAADPAAVQHDNTNFGLSFVAGRGNLTSVRRYDVNAPTQFTTTTTNKYNRVGLPVSSKDALLHEVTVSYIDSFASNGNPTDANPQDATRPFTTLAYPTTVNDAGGYSTRFRYNYDFGARTWQQTPQPNVTTNTAGPIQTFTYDLIGRLERTTSLVNNAFTRYVYGPNYLESFSSINTLTEAANEGHALQVFDGHGSVIAKATKHPVSGAANRFSAALVLYDVMGRPHKESNPTETDITTAAGAPLIPYQFVPQGDDTIANGVGWKYVEQTYDWKGRPLVTTNQDGTMKTASYEGCGCAGGEVVTLTDEGTGVAPNIKKRQQRIYTDVLGRTWKTEALNWDGPGPNGTGGSVYSATVNTYNVRDQITQIRQYAGPDTSGTFQDTTMSYDGYGRLKTQQRPEQQVDANNIGSTDHTTWDYNADDTIQKITDARGAIATMSYNARHLVEHVVYSLSPGVPTTGASGVTVPAAISFDYDAVGNRTKMVDGTGEIDYQYNSLSLLTSEARKFNGPFSTSTFSLTYEYSLAGRLKKITDPTNVTINYNFDAAGKLTAVTGENNLVNGVSQYASNLHYRAWGAVKDMDFGNGTHQHADFNSRLLPIGSNLSNLTGGASMTWSYTYYHDGLLRMTSDAADPRFDRLQDYDHLGRLKEAYSGREARGEAASSPYPDSPYRQTYQYDVWNNQTSKSGRFWRLSLADSSPYVNNRRQVASIYDAEGNSLSTGNHVQRYDATAKQIHFENWRNAVGGSANNPTVQPTIEIDQTYDGNGRPAKRLEKQRTEELINGGPNTNITETITTTYYLYSMVLGAKVLELDENGQKKTGYVYSSGGRLARQGFDGSSSWVIWYHGNAGSESWVESGSLGSYEREEMDPIGAEVGTEDPWANQLQEDPTYENLKDDEPLYIEGGDPFDYSTRGIAFGMPIVTVDGIRATQSQVNRIIRDSGASRFVLFDVTVPFKPLDGARNVTVPIAETWGVALPALRSLMRNIPQKPQRRFDDSLGPPPPIPTLGFTGNQDVLDDLYCLWKKGGYGFNATERSEWITKNGNNYGSVPWPWSAEVGKETWKGPLPVGTVATAHTHPDKSSPKPSTTGGNTGRGDQGTADKIGLPVYVVTRNAIWKAVPNAKNPVQVAGKDWWKPSEKAKVKCN